MSVPESVRVRQLSPDRALEPAHVYTKNSGEGNGREWAQRGPGRQRSRLGIEASVCKQRDAGRQHDRVRVNAPVSTRRLMAQRSAAPSAAFPVRTVVPPDGLPPVLYDVRACLGTRGSPGRRRSLHLALSVCRIAWFVTNA